MFDIFGSLRSVIKLEFVSIDNNVFRLHYKVTVLFLISCSILVASRHYFGDPIDCAFNKQSGISSKMLDTYCWIHPTFTLPKAYNKKIGEEVAHLGIDKYIPGDDKIHHAYYQWVTFVLFIQAVLFYIPRYLWKMWENGKVNTLILSLKTPILKESDKEEEKALLVGYLKNNLSRHSGYFAKFSFCEVLNLINVAGQMAAIDKFLGGTFTTFGTDVIKFLNTEDENRIDPMAYVFPRMTKCTFRIFGASGNIEHLDGLCILPLNIINEKIYIFLWFWFVFLLFLSAVMIVYRILVFVSLSWRYRLLKANAELTDGNALKTVISKCGAGGWFLLNLLCKNMDPVNFKEVIEKLAEESLYSDADIIKLANMNKKDGDFI